jgi:Skp family chaperone for outer membrane proteins
VLLDDYDPDSNYYNTQITGGNLETRYYDSAEFNSLFLNDLYKDKQLSMYHCNIRSANKNANDLSIHMRTLNHEFDIIALTETWLNQNNTEINGFPHYNHEYNFRKSKKGGGVSILLKDSIQYKVLNDVSFSTDIFESLFIEINMRQKNVVVGCIYRPPNSDIVTFNDEMDVLLKQISHLNRNVYLLGDFNINLLKTSTHQSTYEFINTMFSSSFIPLINRPTRVTANTATLIDNIFTNRHDLGKHINGIIPTDVSDHFSVFHIIYTDDVPHQVSSKSYKRCLNDITMNKFSSRIQSIDWNAVTQSTDVETAYRIFFNSFSDTFDKTIPIKEVKHSKVLNKPWITKGILTSIENKNKMYKSLKVNGDKSIEHEYKKIKNKLGNLLRQAEKRYYKDLLDKNKSNLSRMWQTLNQVINRKKKIRENTTFKHNNREISSDADISNHFNQYFLNVAKNLNSNVPSNSMDPCLYMTSSTEKSLFFQPTSEEEILQIISNLKNSSSGYDDIKVKLIKSVKHDILTPLAHICNLSFKEGKIPDSMKIAKILPIHKRGDKKLFANYRPVSILPAFSKIIEKLAYKRIMAFLDKHDVLYKYQFGFRKKRSTDMALYTLVDKFYEAIENDEFMVGIFLDLSKAFDTISHEILLRKLMFYGIRGTTNNWVKDYLTNRKQFVNYNNCKSRMGNIDIGIPQGSILGPLLFLLYINDIHKISDKLSFILFADDTNIFATGKSLPHISNILNTELSMITKWLQANKLSLNVAKTNFMIMSSSGKKRFNPSDCQIFIGGKSIELVNETKFLGVIIDDKLSWKSHINHICNKVSKGIGIIIRARQLLYGESLQTLYNALIKPYFTYCITIWGNTYQKFLHKLHLMQKKIIRILSHSDYLAHTEHLLKARNMMTIYKMHEYFVGIFVYKSLNNQLPEIFNNIFTPNMQARNSFNLRPIYCKLKMSQFSVKIAGIKIWNNFSITVKRAKSILSFKKLLSKELL